MFLHTIIIYLICLIYIYFYILRRRIFNALRSIRNGNRCTISASRVFSFGLRGVLWDFKEVINVTFTPLHKIALVNQLDKLVTIGGRRHSNRLPDRHRGQRKQKTIGIGRKV